MIKYLRKKIEEIKNNKIGPKKVEGGHKKQK